MRQSTAAIVGNNNSKRIGLQGEKKHFSLKTVRRICLKTFLFPKNDQAERKYGEDC